MPTTHVPPTHVSSAPHCFPHEPQLVRSVDVFTHAMPHCFVPIAHDVAHAPAMQTSFAAQALPQAPQLRGSLLLSTHSLPHVIVPFPHELAHMPAEQTSPIAQVLPQLPQFCGSRATTVQVSPHWIAPVPQLTPASELKLLLLHATATAIPSKQHAASACFTKGTLRHEASNRTFAETLSLSGLQPVFAAARSLGAMSSKLRAPLVNVSAFRP